MGDGVSGAERDALMAATEAKTLAETAIAGQDRIERAIEAMRVENSAQHAEGRQNLTRLAQGLHRRLDKQDAERGQLRRDMEDKFAAASRAGQEERRLLHGRINALTWSLLLAAVSTVVALVGGVWWLINNPVRLILPLP